MRCLRCLLLACTSTTTCLDAYGTCSTGIMLGPLPAHSIDSHGVRVVGDYLLVGGVVDLVLVHVAFRTALPTHYHSLLLGSHGITFLFAAGFTAEVPIVIRARLFVVILFLIELLLDPQIVLMHHLL